MSAEEPDNIELNSDIQEIIETSAVDVADTPQPEPGQNISVLLPDVSEIAVNLPADEHKNVQKKVDSAKIVEVPAGTFERIIPMVTSEELPFLKTYTSSRHQTCAVASAHLQTKEINISFYPACDRSSLIGKSPPINTSLAINIDEFLPVHEELAWRVSSEQVNFMGIIYGTTKGIIRTARQSGIIAKRDIISVVKILKGQDWGRVALVPAPAYAPSFARITDENSLKAEKYLTSAFFEVPAGVRDMTRISSRCAELLARRVNAIRFVYRLAILYIYTRFATIVPGQKSIISSIGIGPDTVDATSWNPWQRQVLGAPGKYNYVPWLNARSEPTSEDIRIYGLLIIACSEEVSVGIAKAMATPLFWPPISDLIVLGNFRNISNFADSLFVDAAFVYGTGLAWCNRYGLGPAFIDAIQLVSLLYWSYNGCNLVVGSLSFEFNLPEADMNGFILAPLLQVSDALLPLKLTDFTENMHLRMYESAFSAMLINYARSYQQYYLLDAAFYESILVNSDDQDDALSLILKSDSISYAPVWAVTEACAAAMGFKIALGSIIHSIGFSGTSKTYKRFIKTSEFEHYVHSMDLAPFILRLPEDCGVARWIGAIPPAKKLIANQQYLFSNLKEIGIFKTMRALVECSNVIGSMTIASRHAHSVQTTTKPLFRTNKRGFPSDFLLTPFTIIDGSQLIPGFYIKGVLAEAAINDETNDRYHLKWYYTVSLPKNGMRIKPIPNVFSDPPIDKVTILKGMTENKQKIDRLGKAGDEMLKKKFDFQLNNRRPFQTPSSSNKPSGRNSPSNSTASSKSSSSLVSKSKRVESTTSNTMKNKTVDLSCQIKKIERPTRVWKDKKLMDYVSKLPADLCNKFFFLDQAADGDEVRGWLQKLGKVIESLFAAAHCTGPSSSLRQVGMLSIEFDVIQQYKHTLILEVKSADRAQFLACAADLLQMTLCAYPNFESTTSMNRMLFAMRVLANHLNYNPNLTPSGFLEANPELGASRLAERLCEHEMTENEIIQIVLNQNDPGMVHVAEPLKPVQFTQSACRIMQYLQRISATFDGVETNVQSHVIARYGVEFAGLTSEEREVVLTQCSLAQERLDSLRASRNTCNEQIQHFGSTRDDSDDENGSRGNRSRTQPRRSGFVARPRTRPSRGGNRQHRGGKQNFSSTQVCFGVEALKMIAPLHVVELPKAYAHHGMIRRCGFEYDLTHFNLMFLIHYCPCFLVKQYGGDWPGVVESCCRKDNLTYLSLKEWWDSLSFDEQSRYIILEHYAVAGDKHFQQLFGYNFPTDVEGFSLKEYFRRWELLFLDGIFGSATKDISGDQGYQKLIKNISSFYPEADLQRIQDFKPLKMQGGIPIMMTAKIVLETMPFAGPLIELLHNRSLDSEEYEVATTVFCFFCLPLEIAGEILAQQWFEHPLNQWYKVFKNVLIRTKRSNIFGSLIGESALMLRKFLNVTIRRKGDCDIQHEIEVRAYGAQPKNPFGFGYTDWLHGKRPYSMHMRNFSNKTAEKWRIVVPVLKKRGTSRTANDYWKERAIITPSGASTLIKDFKKEDFDSRFIQEDRPGKRVVIETLSDDFLDDLIKRTAPCNRANYFIKPEPGYKLRPLYSSFDEETFVASYASQSQENEMWRMPGVMIRQTPHDVLTWMTESENGLGSRCVPTQYWLSTDYSDYNAEHTLAEMAVCDAQLACIWAIQGAFGCDVGAKEKAIAALWVALGYTNSWICWGITDVSEAKLIQVDNGNWVAILNDMISRPFDSYEALKQELSDKHNKIKMWTRVINGLYSGSRDTARNNTLIHAVDFDLLIGYLHDQDILIRPISTCLCGDDEDVKFLNVLDAFLYYGTLAPSGHSLNPAKQMGGEYHHEFLQIVWSEHSRVEKPLCAIMATLGSGNWYIQLGVWIQTVVESCICNWWEAYNRGVPLGFAQRACVAYLNRLMFIPAKMCATTIWSETGKELEWWCFAEQNNYPPLFKGLVDNQKRIPRFEAEPNVLKSWPKKASEAYLESQSALLSLLPIAYRTEFLEKLQLDTVGAAMKGWRQIAAKQWAVENWPARSSRIPIEKMMSRLVCIEQPKNIGIMAMNTPKRKRITSESMVYARMGINMFIGRKLGNMYNIGSKIPINQWAKAVNIENQSMEGNASFFELQVNLRACLSYWRVAHPQYHGYMKSLINVDLVYIFMANGSGKSFVKRSQREVDDLDELWTELYGVEREEFEFAAPRSSFTKLTKVMRDILDTSFRLNGFLLGQIQPISVEKAKEDLGYVVNCFYFDPGEEIRRLRLSDRGWSENKIETRLQRAKTGYAEAVQFKWKKINNYTELVDMIEEHSNKRRSRLHNQAWEGRHMEAEYVFDRTEAVTRQLRIKELDDKEEKPTKVEENNTKQTEYIQNNIQREKRYFLKK